MASTYTHKINGRKNAAWGGSPGQLQQLCSLGCFCLTDRNGFCDLDEVYPQKRTVTNQWTNVVLAQLKNGKFSAIKEPTGPASVIMHGLNAG